MQARGINTGISEAHTGNYIAQRVTKFSTKPAQRHSPIQRVTGGGFIALNMPVVSSLHGGLIHHPVGILPWISTSIGSGPEIAVESRNSFSLQKAIHNKSSKIKYMVIWLKQRGKYI